MGLLVMALQGTLMFATVAQGGMSLLQAPRTVVIRSTEDWQMLWKEHSPRTALPTVDFDGAVVVGVFLGSRPTAGYRVEIEAIRLEGRGIVVEYRERKPGPGTIAAQVLTAPFQLVRVPSQPETVEFKKLE